MRASKLLPGVWLLSHTIISVMIEEHSNIEGIRDIFILISFFCNIFLTWITLYGNYLFVLYHYFIIPGYLNILDFHLLILRKITMNFCFVLNDMMISSAWQSVNSLSNMNLKILRQRWKNDPGCPQAKIVLENHYMRLCHVN